MCKGANNNKQSTRAASRQMGWRGMTDDAQADADVDHAVTTAEKNIRTCACMGARRNTWHKHTPYSRYAHANTSRDFIVRCCQLPRW